MDQAYLNSRRQIGIGHQNRLRLTVDNARAGNRRPLNNSRNSFINTSVVERNARRVGINEYNRFNADEIHELDDIDGAIEGTAPTAGIGAANSAIPNLGGMDYMLLLKKVYGVVEIDKDDSPDDIKLIRQFQANLGLTDPGLYKKPVTYRQATNIRSGLQISSDPCHYGNNLY